MNNGNWGHTNNLWQPQMQKDNIIVQEFEKFVLVKAKKYFFAGQDTEILK